MSKYQALTLKFRNWGREVMAARYRGTELTGIVITG